MADSSSDASADPDSNDDGVDHDIDVDRRGKKTERFVLAGAIIGPILLWLWTLFDRSDFSPLSWINSFSAFVLGYLETIVLQALTIWLACRHPILAGKPIRLGLVGLLVVVGIKAVHYYLMDLPPIGASSNFATWRFFMIQGVATFSMGLVALVVARRVFHLVLVRRGETPTYQPSRLSIRELMLWTFVIASYLALYHFAMRWVTDAGVENAAMSGWLSLYFLVSENAPSALLVVAIVYCRRFVFWKWFPIVMLVYLLWSYGNWVFYSSWFNAAFKINIPIDWRSGLSQLWGPALHVVMTFFVVWSFRMLGYRFQCRPANRAVQM